MKFDISKSELGVRNIKATYINNTHLELLPDISADIKEKASKVDAKINPIKALDGTHPALTDTIDTLHSITITNNFLTDKAPLIRFQYMLKQRALIDYFTIVDSLGIDLVDLVNINFNLGINITGGIIKDGKEVRTKGYNDFIVACNKYVDGRSPVIDSKNPSAPGKMRFESIYKDAKLRILTYTANYLKDNDYLMLEITCIPENFYLLNKFKIPNGAVKNTNLSAYIPYLFGTSSRSKKVHIEKIESTYKLNSLVTSNDSVLNIVRYLNNNYGFYKSKTITNFTVDGELLICSCDSFINKTYKLLSNGAYHQHVALIDGVIGHDFKGTEPEKVIRHTDTTKNFSPSIVMMKNGQRVLAFSRDTHLMQLRHKINSSIVRAIGENEYVSNATTRIGTSSKQYSKDPIKINRVLRRGDSALFGEIDHNLKVRLSKKIDLELNSVDIRPFLIPGYVFKYYISNTWADGVQQDEFGVNDYKIVIINDYNGDERLTSANTVFATLYKLSREYESSDIDSVYDTPVEDNTPTKASPTSPKTQVSDGPTPTFKSVIGGVQSDFPDDYQPKDKKAHHLSAKSLRLLSHAHPNIQRIVAKMLYTTTDPFTITGTTRSVEQEREYIRTGRSATATSKHLTNPSIAIDIYPVHNGRWIGGTSGNDYNIWMRFVHEIKATADSLGINIRQGYTWVKPKDFPHFELTGIHVDWPPEVLQLKADLAAHRI